MSKRIVICSDRTWNTPDQKQEGKYNPTNMVWIKTELTNFKIKVISENLKSQNSFLGVRLKERKISQECFEKIPYKNAVKILKL